MRCGCGIAATGAGAGLNGCTTAARGFVGSRFAGRLEIAGFGIPGGGAMDPLLDGIGGGGPTGTTEPLLLGIGGGMAGAGTLPAGAGTLPAPGGGGVVPGAPVPIFWRRDFRSIFGFLSSAIVSA